MNDQPIFHLPPRRTFSREEKVALVLLIVTGLGGLFFGFRYLGKNLQSPFSFSYEGPAMLSESEQEAQTIEQQKGRDTDSNTLNDYDELYVYKTSPYLADSDSDGFSDSAELASGNDPSCPSGKVCSIGVASADTAVDASDAIISGLAEPPSQDLEAAQALLDQAGGAANVLQNLTAAELRELLIANGADEAQVIAMSDAELMTMYQEVLSQYQGAAQ